MTEKIVVGVDISAPSEEALTWALHEAQLRAADVVAVHVAHMPWTMGFDPKWAEDRVIVADEARIEVENEISRARKGADAPAVPVEVKIFVDERPAYLLNLAAVDADLLVVGNRGRGGFAGLLLGSVSTACTHHAPCPVVVVRGQVDGADHGGADRPADGID